MKLIVIAASILLVITGMVWTVLAGGLHLPQAPEQRVLRVCADPNNLPFSNEKREGFENKVAELIAPELGARVEYTWWAQRRGYVRNTLNAGVCDVIPGVPAGMDRLLMTQPYYRSGYMFVHGVAKHLHIASLDDPLLRQLTIGVQLIGDDYENSPPAHALARRGVVNNVRGYRVAGNYAEPNPPARLIEAVEKGDIDVAIAWGPLAGYFAKRSATPIAVEPVSPQVDMPFLPLTFDISMGVRRGEDGLKNELDAALSRRRRDIDRILDQYGVPRLDETGHLIQGESR
jgi:mxaJ protein